MEEKHAEEISFQIISDVHLEFRKGEYEFTKNPSTKYLALLGDIGVIFKKFFLV